MTINNVTFNPARSGIMSSIMFHSSDLKDNVARDDRLVTDLRNYCRMFKSFLAIFQFTVLSECLQIVVDVVDDVLVKAKLCWFL